MRKVTMVKKLLESGEPCAKCAQAEELLKTRGLWEQIDRVVWANESDSASEGMLLAKKHNVELAPFFIVEQAGQPDKVYARTLELLRALSAPAATDASAPVRAAPEADPRPTPALDQNELRELQAQLANQSPAEIVVWALRRFGSRTGIAFSGAEDVVLIDFAVRSGLPFSVFCLDTGRLHEETYRFIDRVRGFYGVEIQVMTPAAEPLQAFVRKKGLFSFLEDGHTECCGIRKIEPLRRVLAQFEAWVSGQRRDQSPSTRSEVNVIELDTTFSGISGGLIKLNPLAFWSSARVWQHIRDERIPYNALHDHGFVSIGCQPCTRPIRPGEHERAARWWWEDATKRECGLHVKRPK